MSGTNWLKAEVNLFLGSGSTFPEVSSREKEEYPGRLGRGFVDFVKSVDVAGMASWLGRVEISKGHLGSIFSSEVDPG